MSFQPRALPFLGVPAKEGGAADWAPQLRAALADVQADAAGFAAEIGALNKQRSDALGAEANTAGLGLLYRYYCQLEAMGCRFPALQKPQHIQFEW